MKKNYILLLVLCTSVFAKSQDTIKFESFNLPVDSFWNGNDLSGKFSEGSIDFINAYDTLYTAWEGFAYSNKQDTLNGFPNQYSCIAGEGANNSTTYGVGFHGYNGLPTLKFNSPVTNINGFMINNSTYAYLSMRDGDGYAKVFGDTLNGFGTVDGTNGEDWMLLTTYVHSSSGIDSNEFYLADYRFADSTQDYIIKDWTYVTLPANTNPDSLTFKITSSDNDPIYGIKTPAYFCVDNLRYTKATVGLTKVENEIDIKLFPNPAVNFVNVTLPANADLSNYSLSLLDANGRLIKSISQVFNSQLVFDISTLNSGTYIVQINTGTSVHSRRLIK
jgi:hypothetical protein